MILSTFPVKLLVNYVQFFGATAEFFDNSSEVDGGWGSHEKFSTTFETLKTSSSAAHQLARDET